MKFTSNFSRTISICLFGFLFVGCQNTLLPIGNSQDSTGQPLNSGLGGRPPGNGGNPSATPNGVPAGAINVLNSGAKGDGSTDDASAIQNAINNCSNGGTVYFPHGTYFISTTLSAKTGCTYTTNESGVTLQGYSGTEAGGYSILGFFTNSGGSTVISNLTFRGGGIQISADMSNLSITRNTFRDILNSNGFGAASSGISQGSGFNMLRNSSIDHNEFLNIYGPGELDNYGDYSKIGFLAYELADVTISNNIFDTISGDSINMPYNTSDTSANAKANVVIQNNTIRNSRRMPIEIQALYLVNPIVSYNLITDYWQPEMWDIGISFAPGFGTYSGVAIGAVVSNNYIDGTNSHGRGAGNSDGTCIELMGLATVSNSNVCKTSVTASGLPMFGSAFMIAGNDAQISNSIFCGPFAVSDPVTYENPYPENFGHAANVNNNITTASCDNVAPPSSLTGASGVIGAQ